MNFYRQLKRLNESVTLLEYNRKDLRNFAGDDYAAKFFNLRDKLQAPENDLGHWIKKGDVDAFKKFIDDWESGAIKSKTQQKKAERMEGADLIFDDKGWKVYHITTYDAAKQLGSGTTWCITGRYHGYESRGQEFFNSYIKDYKLDGGYYFFFDTLNKDPHTNDYLKYCMGITNNNTVAFFYNGMQDEEISRTGIPDMPKERRIQPFTDKGITVPYYDRFIIKDGVLVGVGDQERYKSENITIPEGVTEIGRYAFKGCRYKNVAMTFAQIKKIGLGAFIDCPNLGIITIPDSVTELGKGCFISSGLEGAYIGNGITEIPSRAFAYCDNLEFVTMPKNIQSIADDAFEGSEKVKFKNCNAYAAEYAEKHNIYYDGAVDPDKLADLGDLGEPTDDELDDLEEIE